MKTPAILDISSSRSSLLAALGAASTSITTGKSVIPELGSICIEYAGGTRAAWWATDYDKWRGGQLEIESATAPGTALLPVHQTAAMLKSCADGTVRLVFTEKGVHLTTGGLSARIPTFNVAAFPTRPIVPHGGIQLPAVALSQIMHYVEPATVADAMKSFMCGAFFRITDREILCASTNGHQMSKSSASFQHDADTVETILPKASLVQLAAMLNGAKSARYIFHDMKHVFIIDDDILVSRAIDDKFPQWDVIIPKSFSTRVVCNRDEWLGALKRVMLASDIESRRVRLSVEGDQLIMAASSVVGGDAGEGCVIEKQGPDREVYANGLYVKQFLETALSERVAWEIADGFAPFVFRPEAVATEVGGADYVYVVAPISPP